jgi:hypothetical protein
MLRWLASWASHDTRVAAKHVIVMSRVWQGRFTSPVIDIEKAVADKSMFYDVPARLQETWSRNHASASLTFPHKHFPRALSLRCNFSWL